MEEKITHEVTLIGGYEDKKKITHRRVVFGNRITGADLFRLDVDKQSQNPTQYRDLVMIEAITEFGSMLTSSSNGKRDRLSLKVILDLDTIDREDLRQAHNEFAALSLGDRQPSIMPPDKVKLAFGFKIGEQDYDLVVFGRRTTGRDEVAADKLELIDPGIARMCYLAGRQISKVAIACSKCKGVGSADEGQCSECKGSGAVAGSEIEGPIDLEHFTSLDGVDIQIIGAGADLWRQSFRLRGRSVSGEGQGPNNTPAGNEDGVAGGRDSVAAGGAA